MRERRLGLYLNPAPGCDGGFERALWADRHGFDDIWFPDGDGMRDAMTFAAVVAGRTERARLATGITPVYTRPPAILATSALAIDKAAPGRFVLGLGSSTHTMVEGWYGTPFAKPLTRVRETVEVLQRIFAGEKTRYEGETARSHGFRLKERLDGAVPIFLAAMGPKMLELVGELADGVILNHFTPIDRLPYALEHLDRGAKRAGRRVEDLEIAQRVCAWVTEGAEEEAFRYYQTDFSFYGSTAIYRDVIARIGYPDAAHALDEGFRARDRERIRAAIPSEAIERIYVWGDRGTCQQRVRAFYEAGVDTVVVAPQATNDRDYQATCDAFTREAFDPGGPPGWAAGDASPGAGAV